MRYRRALHSATTKLLVVPIVSFIHVWCCLAYRVGICIWLCTQSGFIVCFNHRPTLRFRCLVYFLFAVTFRHTHTQRPRTRAQTHFFKLACALLFRTYQHNAVSWTDEPRRIPRRPLLVCCSGVKYNAQRDATHRQARARACTRGRRLQTSASNDSQYSAACKERYRVPTNRFMYLMCLRIFFLSIYNRSRLAFGMDASAALL